MEELLDPGPGRAYLLEAKRLGIRGDLFQAKLARTGFHRRQSKGGRVLADFHQTERAGIFL